MIESEVLALCTPEGDRFLREHLHDSPDRLLLALHGKVDPSLLRGTAEQIRCREKLRLKQPRLFEHGALAELSVLEQSTPQEAADFRSSIMNGTAVCDCTGGMGADTLALSKKFSRVVFCEIDPARAQLFRHNAALFGADTIAVHLGDSMEFLRNSSEYFDWLFLDPARRDGSGKRFISLEECMPDVIGNAELLRSKSANIAVKISPAFDISMIYRQFPDLSRIIVISLAGEVREIMITVESGVPLQPIRAVVLGKDEPQIFDHDGFEHLEIFTGLPKILFEPDPAIIKAGLTDTVGRRYGLSRWSRTGVFLCGNEPIPHFPGRQFDVGSILPWQRKEIGRYLRKHEITSASVIRRDFPLSPEQIRAEYKLSENDRRFLIFTADSRGSRVVIECSKRYV